MIIMLLDQLQNATKKEGKINGATVKLKDGSDMKDVQVKIETDIAKQLHTKLEAQSISEYAKSMMQLKLANAMAWLTSTIALLIGGIFMVNHHGHVRLRAHPRNRHPAGDRLAAAADHADDPHGVGPLEPHRRRRSARSSPSA